MQVANDHSFTASPCPSPQVSPPYPFVSCPSEAAPFSAWHHGPNFFREPQIKAFIRQGSEAVYHLIENVCLDGNYHRVKSVFLDGWEHCWDLAVRFQFFGNFQGLALEPESSVFRSKKRIVHKSLVLVNPYKLWNGEPVGMLGSLQERIEFLIARILFHECIHVMVYLGKTFPPGLGDSEIYLEFRNTMQLADSKKLFPLRQEVHASLYRLASLASLSSTGPQKKLKTAADLYEFLIHEKYCIEKTDLIFGFPRSNSRIARDYAWIAALKAGSCTPSDTFAWHREVRRLQGSLKKLYTEIDRYLLFK